MRQILRRDARAGVSDLEATYGAPSEEGFGSAVFFQSVTEAADPEKAAKAQYRTFVGKKWEERGEETWMTPWKEAYRDTIENGEKARKALAAAYDAPQVTDLRAYNLGDGDAMSGLLLAGRRDNGEATFLVFLYD